MMRNSLFLQIVLAIILSGVFVSIPTALGQSIPLTVSTDNQNYVFGQLITISGAVNWIDKDESLRIMIFDPDGRLVNSNLVEIKPDAKFEIIFDTNNNILELNGIYSITATYGSDNAASTFIQLSGVQESSYGGGPTGTIQVLDTDFSIDYSIWGATLRDVRADPLSSSVLLYIDTREDGGMFVKLPRTLIDARLRGADIDFLVHGFGVKTNDFEKIQNFQQSSSPTHRFLTIEFPVGTSLIEISGTQLSIQTVTDSTQFSSSALPPGGNIGIKNTNYNITYEIRGGTVYDIVGFQHENYILIPIDAANDGELTLYMPSEFDKSSLLDNVIVQIDGEITSTIWADQEGSMIIPFNTGSEEIKISYVFPRYVQEIPGWIKNTAQWWAEGQISDEIFIQAMQYLAKVGIISL